MGWHNAEGRAVTIIVVVLCLSVLFTLFSEEAESLRVEKTPGKTGTECTRPPWCLKYNTNILLINATPNY